MVLPTMPTMPTKIPFVPPCAARVEIDGKNAPIMGIVGNPAHLHTLRRARATPGIRPASARHDLALASAWVLDAPARLR